MATISGGDKADQYLKDLGRRLGAGKVLKVGFLEGATHTAHDGSSIPTAAIAAWQNFGFGPTPPRPFFTNVVRDESAGWGDTLSDCMAQTNNDTKKALALLGDHVSGQIQQSITAITSPPLSDITLMLRKMRSDDQSLVVTGKTVGEAARRVAAGESYGDVSTKPLIDSGQMQAAVDWEVVT